MTEPAIVIDRLVVHRGRRDVLRDVSLTIGRGVVTGLVGPSGSGKTTLMRAIVGVQVVRGGHVTVLGQAAGQPALRRQVAYVTQSPSIYTDLTVRENLRYVARILGVPAERIGRAITAVDLDEQADQIARTLSGGESSRASLAVALLGEPDVLVLDEPTVGLDPVLRRDLWNLFHDLARRGAALVVSTHVMDEAARCDDLVLLRDGEVVASTTPGDLRARTGIDDLEAAFLTLAESAPAKEARP
jgi:ABC-2 type transport system ATP-binding protein